jgi:hypothetical protein
MPLSPPPELPSRRPSAPLLVPPPADPTAPPAPTNGSRPSGRLTDTSAGAAPLPVEAEERAPEPEEFGEEDTRTPASPAGAGGARSELRRQLREHKRVRAMALAVVVLVVLGAPMLYFGIVFATRDPVLNSLDGLDVPSWAAQSPEDRIISGSRWCFIDCRFRERVLGSERGTEETTAVYAAALQDAGWTRWEVEGCPLAEVDGDYSCWTRDEYTLDLWVHPPECAYDPLALRPEITAPDEQAQATPAPSPPAEGCTGSVVEIKMQNRVADERGLSGPGNPAPLPPTPTVAPTGTASPSSPPE